MAIKILHLIDSSGYYGTENVIITLCKQIMKTRFVPVLGCIMSEKERLPEVGVVAETYGIQVLPIFQSTKFDWWNLRKVLREQNINLIHSHGYKASVLSFLADGMKGERIIITCHLWTNETLRLNIYAFLESLIMRKAKVVVAVSDTVKTAILRMGIRRKDINVIYNGIDLRKWQKLQNFNKLQYRKKIGLKEDTIVVSLFGRLNKQKGHKFLFEAISGLNEKSIEVICSGDGPLRRELEALSNSLKVNYNVHFLGFRDDVKELLEITDIFVLPSLDEGLPMSLLEAMAMSKPVVVTPVGAIPSVITDRKNGILVQRENVSELKDALQILIKDPRLREYLGRNARETVMEKYSSEKMAAKYLDKYKEMMRCTH